MASPWLLKLLQMDVCFNNDMLNVIEDYALTLRAVHPVLRTIIHENEHLNVHLFISPAGFYGLSAQFLQRWRGTLNIRCEYDCDAECPWFKVFRYVLQSNTRPKFGFLRVSAHGANFSPLMHSLAYPMPHHRSVMEVCITFEGQKEDIMDAQTALICLGGQVTVSIDATIAKTTWGSRENDLLRQFDNTRLRFEGLSLW
jgi:hypothetical protein